MALGVIFSNSEELVIAYPIVFIIAFTGILINRFKSFCIIILKPLKNYSIIKTVLCGIIIDLIFIMENIVLFSCEELLEILTEIYKNYSALTLIAIILLKLLMINWCIESG